MKFVEKLYGSGIDTILAEDRDWRWASVRDNNPVFRDDALIRWILDDAKYAEAYSDYKDWLRIPKYVNRRGLTNDGRKFFDDCHSFYMCDYIIKFMEFALECPDGLGLTKTHACLIKSWMRKISRDELLIFPISEYLLPLPYDHEYNDGVDSFIWPQAKYRYPLYEGWVRRLAAVYRGSGIGMTVWANDSICLHRYDILFALYVDAFMDIGIKVDRSLLKEYLTVEISVKDDFEITTTDKYNTEEAKTFVYNILKANISKLNFFNFKHRIFYMMCMITYDFEKVDGTLYDLLDGRFNNEDYEIPVRDYNDEYQNKRRKRAYKTFCAVKNFLMSKEDYVSIYLTEHKNINGDFWFDRPYTIAEAAEREKRNKERNKVKESETSTKVSSGCSVEDVEAILRQGFKR